MKRKIKLFIAGAAPLAITLVAVACGSSASSAYSSTPYGSATSASAKIGVAGKATRLGAARSSLGRIVVDGKGRTLYLFEKDRIVAVRAMGRAPNTGRRCSPTANLWLAQV